MSIAVSVSFSELHKQHEIQWTFDLYVQSVTNRRAAQISILCLIKFSESHATWKVTDVGSTKTWLPHLLSRWSRPLFPGYRKMLPIVALSWWTPVTLRHRGQCGSIVDTFPLQRWRWRGSCCSHRCPPYTVRFLAVSGYCCTVRWLHVLYGGVGNKAFEFHQHVVLKSEAVFADKKVWFRVYVSGKWWKSKERLAVK